MLKKDNYYCTSKSTIKQPLKEKYKKNGWFLEYNTKIGMYRINHESGEVPTNLMGYSPHRKALLDKIPTE